MKCPKCGSERLVKGGFDYLKNGAVQRYYCMECHRYTVKPIRDAVINTTS
jgi:transposase-like protein